MAGGVVNAACLGWVRRHELGRVNLSCLELRALCVACPLCPVCEVELRAVTNLVAADELERNTRVRAHSARRLGGLWALLAVLLVGCGLSEHEPAEDAPVECVEEPWTPEWCDARSSPQFVVVCEAGERGELGSDGVWSGAPYAACAPAELEPGVMAWCCWGH